MPGYCRPTHALAMLLVSWLALGLGCKLPETALREQPIHRVEVILKVDGATPEEEQALAAQLAEGFGVPVAAPDPLLGPYRVFRLTLHGSRNTYEQAGLGATWAATAGSGLLAGGLLPLYAGILGLPAVPIGAGLGLLGGLAYGPSHYTSNQAQLKEMGYLPWSFRSDWEVLERNPPPLEQVIARQNSAYLDYRSYLRPLPPGERTEAAARQACLRAYAEALVKHFGKKP